MIVVYDEPKRLANMAKHGFDFAEFETAFSFDRFLSRAVRPSRTGRVRFQLIGRWHGRIVVAVIVSPLGSEATSLVSLRRTTRAERFAYDEI